MASDKTSAAMDDAKPPTDDPNFPDLTERVKSGRCNAFIGAGMSLPQYPGWKALVDRLCNVCGVDQSQTTSEDNDSPLRLAQLAKTRNPTAYFSELRRIFTDKDPSHRHHMLAELPFRSYLTTNYDSLLLKACTTHNSDRAVFSVYPNLKLDNRQSGEVFFLHGRIDPNDLQSDPTIVLTKEDYEHAYSKSLLRSFLEQLLPFNSVCFLGCSLDDELLHGMFSLCRGFRSNVIAGGHLNDACWYFLIDRSAVLPDGFDSTGIVPVRYNRINEAYDGLGKILDYWCNPIPPSLRPLRGDEIISYSKEEEVPR